MAESYTEAAVDLMIALAGHLEFEQDIYAVNNLVLKNTIAWIMDVCREREKRGYVIGSLDRQLKTLETVESEVKKTEAFDAVYVPMLAALVKAYGASVRKSSLVDIAPKNSIRTTVNTILCSGEQRGLAAPSVTHRSKSDSQYDQWINSYREKASPSMERIIHDADEYALSRIFVTGRNDPSRSVQRVLAANALAGSLWGVHALRIGLTDPDADVRRASAYALSRVAGQFAYIEAKDPLFDALDLAAMTLDDPDTSDPMTGSFIVTLLHSDAEKFFIDILNRRIVTKGHFENIVASRGWTGYTWEDVFKELIKNGWAQEISTEEIRLTAKMYQKNEKKIMGAVFGCSFGSAELRRGDIDRGQAAWFIAAIQILTRFSISPSQDPLEQLNGLIRNPAFGNRLLEIGGEVQRKLSHHEIRSKLEELLPSFPHRQYCSEILFILQQARRVRNPEYARRYRPQ